MEYRRRTRVALKLARLGSARLGSARLGSARRGIGAVFVRCTWPRRCSTASSASSIRTFESHTACTKHRIGIGIGAGATYAQPAAMAGAGSGCTSFRQKIAEHPVHEDYMHCAAYCWLSWHATKLHIAHFDKTSIRVMTSYSSFAHDRQRMDVVL